MDRQGFNESVWGRGTVGGWRSQIPGRLPGGEDITELIYGRELLMVDGFRCVWYGAREKVKSMYNAIGWGHSGMGELVMN